MSDDCETLTHTNYQRSWYIPSILLAKEGTGDVQSAEF